MEEKWWFVGVLGRKMKMDEWLAMVVMAEVKCVDSRGNVEGGGVFVVSEGFFGTRYIQMVILTM